MKNDETRYHTRKLKLKLTKAQKEQISGILYELTLYYNTYVSFMYKYFDLYKEYLKSNKNKERINFGKFAKLEDLVKEVDNFMISNYDLKWIKTKNNTIRTDMTKRICKNIRHQYVLSELGYRPKPVTKPILRNKLVKTIWFAKPYIKLQNKNQPNRIKLTYIDGWIYVFNYKYINDILKSDIKSAFIKREIDDSYHICLLIDHQKEFELDDDLSNGIGIDLGVRNYATIAGKEFFILPDPYKYNPNLSKVEMKGRYIKHILKKKCDNIFDIYKQQGYDNNEIWAIIRNSNKMQHLYSKHRKLLYRKKCMIEDYIKKISKYIILKTHPKFVCIENLRVHDMRKHTGKDGMREILNRKLAFFIRIFKNVCYRAGIEVRVAEIGFPSSKICAYCGNIREKFSSQHYYICTNPKCRMYGIKVDRDINAAMSVYQLKYGEYDTLKKI